MTHLKDKITKKWYLLLIFLFVFSFSVVRSQGSLGVGLSVSTQEVNPGGMITYNISYQNNSGEDLENVVLSMDLPIDSGLTFISSSYPVEWTTDNRPIWRVGNMAGNSGAGLISLTVSVNTSYESETIIATAEIDAEQGDDLLDAYSGVTTVDYVVDDEQEDGQDEDQEDQEENEEEKNDEDSEITDDQEPQELDGDLVAKGVSQLDIEPVVGGADLSKYEEVNQWDSRFLTIGLVGLVLILVVGLVAFFLGRKSN